MCEPRQGSPYLVLALLLLCGRPRRVEIIHAGGVAAGDGSERQLWVGFATWPGEGS